MLDLRRNQCATQSKSRIVVHTGSRNRISKNLACKCTNAPGRLIIALKFNASERSNIISCGDFAFHYATMRAASGRTAFARVLANSPHMIVTYMIKHYRNSDNPPTELEKTTGRVDELSSAEEDLLRRYAAKFKDPSLSEEKKMEAAGALFDLLICLWGDVSMPDQISKPLASD
ncbi:MAG: hypothetical protein ABJL99_02810 [Aliishimia sp.]